MRAALLSICFYTVQAASAVPLFTDATSQSGVDFVHFNGMSGEHYFSEMMGGGVALFDYDNDGDLDIYLVQGTMLGPDKKLDDASFPPKHAVPLTDRLYRNDSSKRRLRFVDVTEELGLTAAHYGMGVATGDVDNDGWIDLYVTAFGENRLLMNREGRRFEDVTDEAGVGDDRWSVSAAFLDFDRDGNLDLYVGNYVDFSFGNSKNCTSFNNAPDYCSPKAYLPVPDRLFRNTGEGRFEDVTEKAGVTADFGAGLGVIAADFNNDGWIDLYVANDGMPNQLWINQKNARFSNEALLAGVAVNMAGSPEASMGVIAADFDGDGDADLFMTHLTRETNTLYVNDGKGWFEDRSAASVLGSSSFPYTGFGTTWFDYNNDGWLDLFSANGAVTKIEEQVEDDDPYPLHQINQLWRNEGGGKYIDVTNEAGDVFELSEVSRGAASGDLDNDGDLDLVVVNNNGPARILLSNEDPGDAWLGLRMVDEDGKRDQYGALVRVIYDGRTLWRRVRTDGSYASALDPRVVVPADHARLDVYVLWLDGTSEAFTRLERGRYHTLHKGRGASTE